MQVYKLDTKRMIHSVRWHAMKFHSTEFLLFFHDPIPPYNRHLQKYTPQWLKWTSIQWMLCPMMLSTGVNRKQDIVIQGCMQHFSNKGQLPPNSHEMRPFLPVSSKNVKMGPFDSFDKEILSILGAFGSAMCSNIGHDQEKCMQSRHWMQPYYSSALFVSQSGQKDY